MGRSSARTLSRSRMPPLWATSSRGSAPSTAPIGSRPIIRSSTRPSRFPSLELHDRRGHGRSTQTSDGHDMDHYADDLAALTVHLDLQNAVHVGHSTGGGEV